MDSSYNRRQHQKLGQVIQNFFVKAVQIVHQSRVPPSAWTEHHDDHKLNKWFNLYLPALTSTAYVSKDDMKLWKQPATLSVLSSLSDASSSNPDLVQPLPPMIVETYLDLRKLGPSQTLVLNDMAGNPWTVAKGATKKHEVVLERWLIEFDALEAAPLTTSSAADSELPLVYKQAIVLFRSLYAYTRLLPAYKLHRFLKQLALPSLAIGIKVLDGNQPISSKGRVGLSKSIIPPQVLAAESHMLQKHFAPIQTSLGTLKVSVAYRTHHSFGVHDSEEILSTHFISIDKNPNHGQNDDTKKKRVSIASMSVSPCSSKHSLHLLHLLSLQSGVPPSPSGNHSGSTITSTGAGTTPTRPAVQPFKIGSISALPPVSSSLERRISITSNKSTSNASLVAMLRNPRNSTSSSNTTSIPIISTGSASKDAFPRSVSSSHADDSSSFNPSEDVPNPRFSSSFGSRASRRYSNTSIKHSSSVSHESASLAMAPSLSGQALVSSSTPLSGVYVDDDISDFVKMIDSKSDLRFQLPSYGQASADSKLALAVGDSLSRFQQMKHQHQQLGESLSNSLVLQCQNLQLLQLYALPHQRSSPSPIVPSRSSSRKSSTSVHSPPALVGSYEATSYIPSIHSRLRESHSVDERIDAESPGGGGNSRRSSFNHSNNSFLRSSSRLVSSPVTSTTIAHAHKTATSPAVQEYGISGLSTTPSTYRKQQQQHLRYENVFEDDDDDDHHRIHHHHLEDDDNDAGVDFYLSKKAAPLLNSRGSRGEDEFDDDDFLFTMSDMNLAK